METILIILGSLIVGAIIGYKFCKMRWMCEEMLIAFNAYIDLSQGKITPEKALEIIKKLNIKTQ